MDNGVAILAVGNGADVGGGAMRRRSLREAMSQHQRCVIRDVACHRWFGCRRTCQASGTAREAAPDTEPVWYFDAMYCPARADQLADELRDAGVCTVVCSGLETQRYVRDLAARKLFTVVFDMHNVELPLHRAINAAAPVGSVYADRYTLDHLGRLADAEGAAVAAADAVWTCSEADRRLVASTYPATAPAKVRVVPNVLPVEQPQPDGGPVARVTFTGRLDYFPNVEAARVLSGSVAPRLARMGYRLPVVIAGAGVSAEFEGTTPPPNVRLVSDPGSVRELIAGSIVAVPLGLGGGSRFKVLEAFALGAPVVSTGKGVEGLDVRPGVHYLCAETPAEFAAAIGRLVDDRRLRASLVTAGYQLVQRRYSVSALATLLRDMPPARPAPDAGLPAALRAWPGLELGEPQPGGHRNLVRSAWWRGRRLVVRRSARPESLDWELDLLEHLRAAGVGVPGLVPTADGRRHVDGYAVFEYVAGREPRDLPDWRRVRDALTRLHQATPAWPQRPGAAASGALLVADGAGEVRLDPLPQRVAGTVRAAWAAVQQEPHCVVHGDVSPANIRIDGDRVTLLDWDEARVDVPGFDFAFLPGALDPGDLARHRRNRIAGLAWEVAYCWAADPVYARRRLAELFRTIAEKG